MLDVFENVFFGEGVVEMELLTSALDIPTACSAVAQLVLSDRYIDIFDEAINLFSD